MLLILKCSGRPKAAIAFTQGRIYRGGIGLNDRLTTLAVTPGWQQIIIKESYVQIEIYACETRMCDCSKCSSRSRQSSSGCNGRNEVKQNLNGPSRKCCRQHRAGGAAILLFNDRLAPTSAGTSDVGFV